MIFDVGLGSIYQSTLEGLRGQGIKKELDKNAFLLLMLTELQHQDPLEPLENKDLIAQLSQLTALEQIMNMSKAVQEFVEAQQMVNPAQLASLIGKYVVMRTNEISVQNGEAESIVFNLDGPAHVVIRIYDENDNLIREEDLGIVERGMHAWVWDARNNDGIPVPDGTYKYKVVKVDGTNEEEIGGLEGGMVEAVQIKDGKAYVLVDGNLYPIDSIVEISEPKEEG